MQDPPTGLYARKLSMTEKTQNSKIFKPLICRAAERTLHFGHFLETLLSGKQHCYTLLIAECFVMNGFISPCACAALADCWSCLKSRMPLRCGEFSGTAPAPSKYEFCF